MLDLLIRNGNVVDGTGRPARRADVAVQDGRIVAVGPNIDAPAAETIDATGKIVTPGFIDMHTHYDGQVTWDGTLMPSSGQGVTTIVIGSCGIGFAPVRKGDEDWLIRLTEGVEDIPGTALHIGIPWGWESYTDYLDTLDGRAYAVNIAAHVPHSAVRAYVLGKRAETDEPATEAEIAEIARIVGEAIAAGAVGIGTSRVAMHRSIDGGILPGTTAAEEELMAMARAMQAAGGGVFQMVPSGLIGGVRGQEGEQNLAHLRDEHMLVDEIAMMRRIHQATGQPITFTFGPSASLGETEFNRARAAIDAISAAGENIHPQFTPRPVGGLISLGTHHMFTARPGYRALAHLPLAERAARMADPMVKAAILAQADIDPGTDDPQAHVHAKLQRNIKAIYSLKSLDYEPDPATGVAAIAAATGRDPFDVAYDMLIEDGGRNILIWFATGYLDGDLRTVESFLSDEQYVMGGGDGGAHVRFICDANFPTFLLSYWGRRRKRGRTFPIEKLVQKITSVPAELYGLADRGVIAPGKRADLNVIDMEKLDIGRPYLANDLPAGAERFLQDATGYDLTIVDGVVTRRHDRDTGARPGRLIRKRHGDKVAVRIPEPA